jgi:hypothetical protein
MQFLSHFIEKLSPVQTWVLNLLAVALVGWLDATTGFEFSILPLYFIPVAVGAWRLKKTGAIAFSFLAALTWLGSEFYAGHIYNNSYAVYWNALMRWIYFGAAGIILAHLRQSLLQQRALIAQLQDALNHVKTLKGILPVCPVCSKIRSDNGQWEDLEDYVKNQTNVEFMSNTCPDCIKMARP